MPHRPQAPRWRKLCFSLPAVVLLCCSTVGHAGDDRDHDHDRARQALEAGQVLPLRTILERVEREYPGQVMDVELEREHEGGRKLWIYKIKVLRSGGTLIKLKLDARDGSVLGSKTRGRHSNESPSPTNRPGAESR